MIRSIWSHWLLSLILFAFITWLYFKQFTIYQSSTESANIIEEGCGNQSPTKLLRMCLGESSRLLNAYINGTSVCKDTRRPLPDQLRYRNGIWHLYKNDIDEIIVYSAFYDDRPELGVEIWLRVHGVASFKSNQVIKQHARVTLNNRFIVYLI